MMAIPWRLVGWGVVALVVVVLAVKFANWCAETIERAGLYETAVAEREEMERTHGRYVREANEKAAAAASQAAIDRAADEALTARAEKAEAEADALRLAAARVKPTVESDDGKGNVVRRIRDDWLRCQFATLGRDAADSAACVASSAGDAGLPAGAG